MVEITKNPIYKVQVFELVSKKKTKSRIVNLYGIVGKKVPKLDTVADMVKDKMRTADGLVVKS